MKEKVINFLKNHETTIVLILGFILVTGLSFEAGFLQGKKTLDNPLVIEKASQNTQNEPQATQNTQPVKETTPTKNVAETSPQALPQNCSYVGSKNSNKYHLPTCRWAKQIKPENVICFSSLEDATAKNYLPDKNCIK